MFGVNTITPAWLHAPPRPAGASQIICTGPPEAATVRSLPLEKKPMVLLSGDQKGNSTLWVPGIAAALPLVRSRTQSSLPFGTAAGIANFLPSGEMTAPP